VKIISRTNTVIQKIDRNIKYLYKTSGKLDLKYPHIRVFHYIQGICSLVVEKNVPLWKIYFDSEIDLLQEMLDYKDFSNLRKDKAVMNLYNCIMETNKMIKSKYKLKI
jgi:hypothetical protein